MNIKVSPSALLLFSMLVTVSGQQTPSPSAPAQSNPRVDEPEIVRIATNLVQVDVVVTRDGKQVTDLKPEDFELFEDGRPQKITNFSYVSNVPANAAGDAGPSRDKSFPIVPNAAHPRDVRRSIALLVDDLGMSNESIVQARRQIRKFVDEQLQPNDLVAIIRTGGEVGALQQFTTDKRLLHTAIEQLKWNHCSRTGVNVFRPFQGLPAEWCGGHSMTNTLEAIRFVVRGMGELPGRKAMLLFSDSIPLTEEDPGPNATEPVNLRTGAQTTRSGTFENSNDYEAFLARIAELAIRSSVVIYSVDTRGLQYTGPTAADGMHWDRETLMRQSSTIISERSNALIVGREGSQMLARQTGGFLVRNSNDFGIDRVMDDQRGYYLLGYRPNSETFNRHFHQLKVRVKPRGVTARTRTGFFGVTDEEARRPELTSGDRMRLALMSPFGGSDISLRLTTFFANEVGRGSLLRSFLHLSTQALTFTDNSDRTRTASFDVSSVIFGDNGKVLDRQDRVATLRLSEAAYALAQREGLVYSFDTPVKKSGAWQFRVAVRDQASARIGAAGQFVEVPDLRQDRLALSGIVLRRNLNLQPRQTEDEITGGSAVRQFSTEADLMVVYAVYNAQLDQTTRLPDLKMQVRIFHDGKVVFTGVPKSVDLQDQTDQRRLIANTRLQLGPELPPGDYALQIIVEDRAGKPRQASQWIDFQLIK